MPTVFVRPKLFIRRRRRLTFSAFTASGTISCTDKTAGRVYQRAAGTAAKTISFAGTYTGTAPTTIEIRLVAESDDSTLQDWTAIDSPTIGGGSWSGTLSVPEGPTDDWYNFLARGKDSGGTVFATSAQTSNKWGVGVLVAMLGQSNMTNMFDVSSTPPASSDFTRKYTSAWAVVDGNGAIRFANLLQDALGLPIGLFDLGVSGSAMDTWVTTGGAKTTNYNAFETAMDALDGDCEFVLWNHGESDAINATSKAQYKASLGDLYGFLMADTGRDATQIKFGISLVRTGSTNANTDAIRQAQLEFIDETTGAFYAASCVDLVLIDAFHFSAASYERLGRRYTQAILNQLGEVAFGADGPIVASASRASGSPDIEITVTHDGGTAIEELDGSTDGGSLTGWQVSDDDFATTLTISSTSFVAGKIVLTLSAAPADVDTIKVRYQYGAAPTITNPVYDDTVPQSDTIGLPLQPTMGSVTASLTGSSVSPNLLHSNLLRSHLLTGLAR